MPGWQKPFGFIAEYFMESQTRPKTYRECDFDQMRLGYEFTLLKLGEPQPKARRYADYLLDNLRQTWAGDTIYIPKMTLQERENKKQEFLAEFNGDNRRALCDKYGISKRTSFRWTQNIEKTQ
jgi:hypothetical protein